MSRSGYHDDIDDNWALIRWRGAVNSAIRGKRGQAFLREMLAALDALPEKRLIEGDLVREDGEVCALGSVAKARGIDVSDVDPYDHDSVAGRVGIPHALACEIMYENDDCCQRWSPEERFEHIRKWVVANLEKGPEDGK